MKKQLPLTGIPLPERRPQTTGWPAPALAQDDCRALFQWFADRANSRQQVRDQTSEIDWQVDASPWPMPPARPWAPVPQTGLKAAWDRILEAVQL